MKRRDFILCGLLSALTPFAKAGAWESGSFDNDDALDWAGHCSRSKGSSFVASTLNAALVGSYLEAPECSAAIAAAEVVAAAKGNSSKSLPKELFSWLEKQQKADIAKLSPVAIKAVTRILNGPKSELQELWLENKKVFPVWKDNVQSLLIRLK